MVGYNGTKATWAAVTRRYGYREGTGWRSDWFKVGEYLPTNQSYFPGNTWSRFPNNVFCWPLPTVYTYYYYNRV
jgi:hypothetical protein